MHGFIAQGISMYLEIGSVIITSYEKNEKPLIYSCAVSESNIKKCLEDFNNQKYALVLYKFSFTGFLFVDTKVDSGLKSGI